VPSELLQQLEKAQQLHNNRTSTFIFEGGKWWRGLDWGRGTGCTSALKALRTMTKLRGRWAYDEGVITGGGRWGQTLKSSSCLRYCPSGRGNTQNTVMDLLGRSCMGGRGCVWRLGSETVRGKGALFNLQISVIRCGK
jgi:hypothetical protein